MNALVEALWTVIVNQTLDTIVYGLNVLTLAIPVGVAWLIILGITKLYRGKTK